MRKDKGRKMELKHEKNGEIENMFVCAIRKKERKKGTYIHINTKLDSIDWIPAIVSE